MSKPSRLITREMIADLKAGDEQALKAIFEQLQPGVYRFLWLKLNSVEIAEDLVQETFLRLWQTRTRLHLEGSLEAFVYRIAANLARDEARKREPRGENERLAEVFPANESAESLAETNQLKTIIESIVAKLAEAPRTAFVLSRYQGLSHKEIAEVMDISVKTVEKHVGRALLEIKKGLKRFGIKPLG